jgi:hypothetical protein
LPANLDILHRWSKEENLDISFYLITIIEDSMTFKVAFGFDKGDVSQGILNNGQEDQITPGSEIHNMWSMCVFDKSLNHLTYTSLNPEKIQSKFLWYKQMHALMGMSPVID